MYTCACMSVYLCSLRVCVSVCPLPSSSGVWAPHRRGGWGSDGPGSAWRWPHRWSPPERRAGWAHLSSDTSQLRSAGNKHRDFSCVHQPFSALSMVEAVWAHRFMHLFLFMPTSAQNAKKKRTAEAWLWPSSRFNFLCLFRELNRCEVQVYSPPSLPASATLLSSLPRRSRLQASRTASDPSLGWGRSEPAAARQEEHRCRHHRAVWSGLLPPGPAEAWETSYERRRPAGPAGGSLLRLGACR